MRNKLSRTITGAAVLALAAGGVITSGTANAATDVPGASGAVSETANVTAEVADSPSIELTDSVSAAVADAVWTAEGWPAPSADPHLPDAKGDIAAVQQEDPQPLIDESVYGPDPNPVSASADSADSAAAAAAAAAAINGHGTANWAYNNLDTRWEYRTDCANFVSKALYNGGGMKMRPGGRKADNAWWQGRYGFGKSWSWTSADYLRRHVTKWRNSKVIAHQYDAKVGDLVFFKWKRERIYNHVAIVSAMVQGRARIVQHGLKNETTLNEVINRYAHTSNPIEKVTIVRPKTRS